MTVTSIQVSIDRVQADGTRKIWYLINDSIEGEVQVYRGPVPAGFDADSDFPSFSTMWEATRENIEVLNAIKRVEGGEDSLQVANNPVRTTSKKLAKRLIYYAIRSRDVYFIIALEPLVEFLKANYTNQQLANYLDITLEKLSVFNSKYNLIISSKANLISADVQEEW